MKPKPLRLYPPKKAPPDPEDQAVRRRQPDVMDDNVVDERALDYGPATKPITNKPLWWGPADPNHPSPVSDPIWRPEQWEQRYLRRWYHMDAKQKLVKQRGTQRRAAPFDLDVELYENYSVVDYLGRFFDLRGPGGVALGHYPTVEAAIRAAGEAASTTEGKVYVMTDNGVDLYDFDGRLRGSWSGEELLQPSDSMDYEFPRGRRGRTADLSDQDAANLCNEVYEQCGVDRECYEIADDFRAEGLDYRTDAADFISRQCRVRGGVARQALAPAEQDRILDTTKYREQNPDVTDKDADLLRDLALQFCHDYDALVVEWTPRFGRGWETSPSEFMLVWGPDQDLQPSEQDDLWGFMVATGLYSEFEHKAWRRLRSSRQILRSDIPRTAQPR